MPRSSKPKNTQKDVSLKYPNHRVLVPFLEDSRVSADKVIFAILIIRRSVTNSLHGRTEPQLCEFRTFSCCQMCQLVLLQYRVRDCTRCTAQRVHRLSARNGSRSQEPPPAGPLWDWQQPWDTHVGIHMSGASSANSQEHKYCTRSRANT